MKLIQQSAELWQQPEGEIGIYKQIERAARTCYRSEDKITADSAKPFVERLAKAGHLAMLEHGTVYLRMPASKDISRYEGYPYTKVYQSIETSEYTIITNYRFIVERHLEEDMQYLWEPPTRDGRITLKFTTSIGVSREFNRHRTFSVAEQSTRYCNYSKNKFGNEVTFIVPDWVNTHCPNTEQPGPSLADMDWSASLQQAEFNYMKLLQEGWKPQQAREVLPLSTATEVVYTAFEEDWRHFFKLRSLGVTGQPHPNAKQVADLAHDLIFKELGKDLYEDEKVITITK